MKCPQPCKLKTKEHVWLYIHWWEGLIKNIIHEYIYHVKIGYHHQF